MWLLVHGELWTSWTSPVGFMARAGEDLQKE